MKVEVESHVLFVSILLEYRRMENIPQSLLFVPILLKDYKEHCVSNVVKVHSSISLTFFLIGTLYKGVTFDPFNMLVYIRVLLISFFILDLNKLIKLNTVNRSRKSKEHKL